MEFVITEFDGSTKFGNLALHQWKNYFNLLTFEVFSFCWYFSKLVKDEVMKFVKTSQKWLLVYVFLYL